MYYKTGDLGVVQDGYLYLQGRCKNMILLKNGLNIIPEELEDMIGMLDYIDEVLVYEENEQIVAEIFSEDIYRAERINRDIAEINSKLPNYKNIRKIKIRNDRFNRTSTGKVVRDNR